jgi:hypothetical protein
MPIIMSAGACLLPGSWRPARRGRASDGQPCTSHASRMRCAGGAVSQQQVANQLFSTYFFIVPNKNGQ